MKILKIFNFGIRIYYDLFISSVLSVINNMYGVTGDMLRRFYWGKKLKKIGKNVTIKQHTILSGEKGIEIYDNVLIDPYCIIGGYQKPSIDRREIDQDECYSRDFKETREMRGYLIIGEGVHIAPYVLILGGGGVKLGKYAGIAAGSRIYSMSNTYIDPENPDKYFSCSNCAPRSLQCVKFAPVIIEDYAFIGANSIILPGVTIGKGAIIGAGSVVNKNIPPNSVAVGVPAKVIKKRK